MRALDVLLVLGIIAPTLIAIAVPMVESCRLKDTRASVTSALASSRSARQPKPGPAATARHQDEDLTC